MTSTNMLQHWKRCIVLSSILVCCFTSTGVQACYFTAEREDLRYMLFNPDLISNKSWWSFFYSAHWHAFDGAYNEATTDEDKLISEWMAAAGNKADTAAAWACIFGSLPDSLLDNNAFYKQLTKQPAWLRYYKLARRSEKLSGVLWSGWINEADSVANGDYDDVIGEIEASLQKETNPALQKKYAFQLVKLAYYWGDSTLCNTTYSRYFKQSESTGVLDWWATHYKAMQLEQAGQRDSANYLHARVYAHCTAKMLVSQNMYSSKNFDKVLALATTHAARADVYVMRETINPGQSLPGIQQVYTLSPNHVHLPLLIGREINKLEDWLGTTKYINATVSSRDYWSERPVMENWQRDRAYLDQFVVALARMDALAKAYPAYYNLAMATLKLMQGNQIEAGKHLAQVDDRNSAVDYQATVLHIVLLTQQKDLRKQAVQNELGQLYKNLLDKRMDQFESMKVVYSLSAYLRYTFTNKGLIYLAGLFENYSTNKFCYSCLNYGTFEYSLIKYLDQHASVKDLETLIDRYNQKDKNALEEVLFQPFSHPYYFYDLLATKYLREGDVNNALAILRQVPDTFWFTFSNAIENLDSDPFTVNENLFAEQTMTSYTKREIIERMDALEQEAATNPASRARNYFMLGNAWYNFTDNSWFMLSYGNGSATPDESVYSIGYKRALTYYQQALNFEQDGEQRAKLFYMLALLTQQKDKKLVYARSYEKYETTKFYNRRNCLTLHDMVN